MTTNAAPLPDAYRRTTRIVVRYAIVMTVVALLAGISFQESTKKYDFEAAPPGLHMEGVLPLALVHGHLITMGVLLPIALVGALHLSRRAGGREVGGRTLRLFVGLYLPFAALSVALQLVKGYHRLLALRGGETDFAAIDARFLGGSHLVRVGVYGFVHTAMAVGLVALLWGLWRSLRTATHP